MRVCLRKYTDFNGRASRSEYWWFQGAVTLVLVLLNAPLIALIITSGGLETGPAGNEPTLETLMDNAPTALVVIAIVAMLLSFVVSLAVLLPSLAVGARRLHDVGMSGWLQLLLLISCFSIIVIVMMVLKGNDRPNKYDT